MENGTDLTTIGLLLFDGAEELDFVGPFEVFTMANEVAHEDGQGEVFDVQLISQKGGTVRCAKGMVVETPHSIREITRLDVICIPGGRGTREQIENQSLLEWVASVAPACRWVTSVCTGAFILSAAGLTAGKKMTTHWAAFDEFADLGLEGDLQAGPRYVRDGNLVTAAGVSAGIDMALWLTGQLLSPEMARATQKAMEYDPAPPYGADV
ncbi:MAG: DJ-1/PfpI family protein [Pseudomonadota bacterium]